MLTLFAIIVLALWFMGIHTLEAIVLLLAVIAIGIDVVIRQIKTTKYRVEIKERP